ncbi:rcc01693 family protein [Palleronia sp. KMU-117]|uniref:rcc01693 family protein n=1 Tax=Palleronia sp. KMU-117 TaxID=3434108 RepID=UPI003D725067
MSRFDWAGLMRAGMQGLRLRPRDFWQLTPAELLLMLGPDAAGTGFGRSRLEELSRQFPDEQGEGTDGRD